MQFEMNRTWSQAVALVQANFQLLAVIAGIFMLLPSLVFYFMVPDVLSFGAMESDPEAMTRRMEGMFPSVMGYGVISLILQTVGYMAMIALMGEGRPTVSEAIGRGFRGLPTAVGTMLLALIGFFLFMLLFSLVVGIAGVILAALSGSQGGGIIGLLAILYLVLLVVTLYLFGRLSLTLPAIVLDEQRNPWRALVRSWRLTAPRAWAILGFFVLLFIVYMVVAMVLMMVLGALGVAAGSVMGTGSLVTASLLYGLIGMAAAMLMSAILVSMHGQLAGTSKSQIAETFE